jgi:hypothetical protein
MPWFNKTWPLGWRSAAVTLGAERQAHGDAKNRPADADVEDEKKRMEAQRNNKVSSIGITSQTVVE